MNSFEENGIFKAPFRAMLAGPSNCGKTSFIIEILNNPEQFSYLKNLRELFIATEEFKSPLKSLLILSLLKDYRNLIFLIMKKIIF